MFVLVLVVMFVLMFVLMFVPVPGSCVSCDVSSHVRSSVLRASERR